MITAQIFALGSFQTIEIKKGEDEGKECEKRS